MLLKIEPCRQEVNLLGQVSGSLTAKYNYCMKVNLYGQIKVFVPEHPALAKLEQRGWSFLLQDLFSVTVSRATFNLSLTRNNVSSNSVIFVGQTCMDKYVSLQVCLHWQVVWNNMSGLIT